MGEGVDRQNAQRWVPNVLLLAERASFAPTSRRRLLARLIELVGLVELMIRWAARQAQSRSADCTSPRRLTCEAQRGSSRMQMGVRIVQLEVRTGLRAGVSPSGYASVVLTVLT